mmetsp:Transcript_22758/g.63280  ORF Transcript_22758/g.63280 Transcript_22758/m.63280 type:complete len:223 (-) Transcript_22758:191-859(-)
MPRRASLLPRLQTVARLLHQSLGSNCVGMSSVGRRRAIRRTLPCIAWLLLKIQRQMLQSTAGRPSEEGQLNQQTRPRSKAGTATTVRTRTHHARAALPPALAAMLRTMLQVILMTRTLPWQSLLLPPKHLSLGLCSQRRSPMARSLRVQASGESRARCVPRCWSVRAFAASATLLIGEIARPWRGESALRCLRLPAFGSTRSVALVGMLLPQLSSGHALTRF